MSVCPSSLAPVLLLPCPPRPRQHWDQGRGHPEEPEWPVARPGLPARPQPPVLCAFAGSQPQLALCLVLPECGLPVGQAEVQLRAPPARAPGGTAPPPGSPLCSLPLRSLRAA